ncbi:MAG: NAD(P)-binding protein [Bacteroidales bacterium]
MEEPKLRIGIIGGGIGGLSLAHGLMQSGFPVTVYEQNAVASDTGGYRLHLTEESLEALRRLVPASLSAAIEFDIVVGADGTKSVVTQALIGRIA